MKDLLSYIILPLPIFWLGIIFSVISYFLRKKIFALKIGCLSIIWLLLISTSYLPNILVKSLERKYEPISIKQLVLSEATNILVLGGGFTLDKSLPLNDQLSEISLCRLIEGIRLHKLLLNSTLITSGYGGREPISQAEISRNVAIMIGVDSTSIRMQGQAKDTKQESENYLALFGNSTNLILVTSAIHMPRAMILFENLGLKPIPAPTNHLVKVSESQTYKWVPSSNNIRKMEAVIHEYVGMLWYHIIGLS